MPTNSLQPTVAPGLALRRRAFLLCGVAATAHASGSTRRTNSAPDIVAPEEGWRRIRCALHDPHVGMFTTLDERDMIAMRSIYPIRVTDGLGRRSGDAANAAALAVQRHLCHFGGPYAELIMLVANARHTVSLKSASRAEGKVLYGMEHAMAETLQCGFGMYIEPELGDAIRVTVISVKEPAIHRLMGPLLSEPWKW